LDVHRTVTTAKPSVVAQCSGNNHYWGLEKYGISSTARRVV
jgi:hypothetical protein